jgi:hypothetical protein
MEAGNGAADTTSNDVEVAEQNVETPDYGNNNSGKQVYEAFPGAQPSAIFEQSQQQQPFDWKATVPEDLRPVVDRHDSVESLARSNMELQRIVGKKFNSFSDSDWQLFMQANERLNDIPESPDGYNLEFQPKLESSQNMLIEGDVNGLKTIVHSLGLNRTQAQGIHTFLNELANFHYNALEQQRNDYIAANKQMLEKEWGDSYQQKMQAVEACFKNVLPSLSGLDAQQIKNEMEGVGAHHSAAFLKIMASLGEMSLESGRTGYNAISTFDARTRLDQMKQDSNVRAILGNRHHRDYPKLSSEFKMLSRIANKEV